MYSFLRKAVIGSAPPPTAALSSLRVLFNFFIVLGHTHFFAALSRPSLRDQISFSTATDSPAALLHNLVLGVILIASVDIFFTVSGFCLVHTLASSFSSPSYFFQRLQPRNVLYKVFSRWLRLAPIYGIVAATFRYRNLNAPELFLLGNQFVPEMADYSLPTGWSQPVDIQAHAMILLFFTIVPPAFSAAPLVVIAAMMSTMKSIVWLRAGQPAWPVGASVIDFLRSDQEIAIYAREIGITPGAFDVEEALAMTRRAQRQQYDPFYYSVFARAPAVLLGAAVGISIINRDVVYRFVRRHPNSALFFASTFGFFYWIGLIVANNPDRTADTDSFVAVFEGFGRFFVSLATGVLIMLVTNLKHDDVPCPESMLVHGARKLLANKWLIALSRTTFVVSLIHSSVMGLFRPLWENLSLSHGEILCAGVLLYCSSVVCAVPFCILEELCLTLRRRLLDTLLDRDSRKGKKVEKQA